MKIIYVDMDDTLCDYQSAYEQHLADKPDIKYPQSQLDFYRNLAPIKGAIANIKKLHNSPLFKVYILTAPSLYNPLCYTEKRLWVEDRLGMDFVENLIISFDKSLLKGDYLIDDYDHGRGQENFEGELIHFGSADFCDWDKILHYFETSAS